MVARSLNFSVIRFSSLMVMPDKVHKIQSVRPPVCTWWWLCAGRLRARRLSFGFPGLL